jgi:hypothetical protein
MVHGGAPVILRLKDAVPYLFEILASRSVLCA